MKGLDSFLSDYKHSSLFCCRPILLYLYHESPDCLARPLVLILFKHCFERKVLCVQTAVPFWHYRTISSLEKLPNNTWCTDRV